MHPWDAGAGYRAVFAGYARETSNPGLMEALSIAADADEANDDELAASLEIDEADRLEAEAALRLLGAGNPSSER